MVDIGVSEDELLITLLEKTTIRCARYRERHWEAYCM